MRVFMVWESNTKVKYEELIMKKGKIRISDNSQFSLVYFESECPNGVDDVRQSFTELYSKGLMCRSIRIFENGPLPKLEKFGFSHNGLFYVNTDYEIPITAVPYGTDWCMILERRKKGGVQRHMLNYIPYFQEAHTQLSFDNLNSFIA